MTWLSYGIMAKEIIVLAVFGLAMAHGWVWSARKRDKALQRAYAEIRDEVRRERSGEFPARGRKSR